MKMMKNTRTTMNTLIMSHLFDVMPLKYFSSSVWAASTFICVSLTLVSILKREGRKGRRRGERKSVNLKFQSPQYGLLIHT